MATVIEGGFEWDSEKAAANLKKHGVSFARAVAVLQSLTTVFVDDGSETGRIVAIGFDLQAVLLAVVHVDVETGTIRIISARKATAAEAAIYTANQGE